MKKVISIILTMGMLLCMVTSYASPHDNFEYTEFANYAHIQKTNGGFIATKEDKTIVYYDKVGNETNDIVSAVGDNVFYVESENESINEYNPETGEGKAYTRRHYYLYDNHNRFIEKLASDEYDIRQTDDYIITANFDNAIENIRIRFYAKEMGKCVSELPANEYRIWITSGEDTGFDLSHFSMAKGGQFIFIGENGLCGTADIYGNIGLERKYSRLSLLDYENEYYTTMIENQLCVIDKTGEVLKEINFKSLSKLYDENGTI